MQRVEHARVREVAEERAAQRERERPRRRMCGGYRRRRVEEAGQQHARPQHTTRARASLI